MFEIPVNLLNKVAFSKIRDCLQISLLILSEFLILDVKF